MKHIVFFILIFIINGCAAKHVYEGPHKPESELSKIYFSPEYYGPTNGVSVSDMYINGTELGAFDAGAYTEPGEQRAQFYYTIFFKDCWLIDDDACPVYTNSGSCQVKFPTEAGKNYKIEVRKGRDVAVFVIEEKSYRAVANTVCNPKPTVVLY